jgi:hypothetical protein
MEMGIEESGAATLDQVTGDRVVWIRCRPCAHVAPEVRCSDRSIVLIHCLCSVMFQGR